MLCNFGISKSTSSLYFTILIPRLLIKKPPMENRIIATYPFYATCNMYSIMTDGLTDSSSRQWKTNFGTVYNYKPDIN